MAKTFATLFLNHNLRKQLELINVNNKDDFLLLIKKETEERSKKYFVLNNLDLKDSELHSQTINSSTPKFNFSMLKGLRNDLSNVVKYYKNDYLDIFKDRKSQLKALSTTIFLYFTIILPTIAFGSVNDKNTGALYI